MRCKLCALCLKSGHIARECKHPKKCTAQNCDRPHHPLLNDKEMACVLYTEIHGEYPPEESQDVQGREDTDYSKEEKREVISTPLYRGTLNVPCAGIGTAKHRPFRPSLYRRIFYQEGYKREGTADTSKSNANAWFSLEDLFSGASGSPGVPNGLFLVARAWTLRHYHLWQQTGREERPCWGTLGLDAHNHDYPRDPGPHHVTGSIAKRTSRPAPTLVLPSSHSLSPPKFHLKLLTRQRDHKRFKQRVLSAPEHLRMARPV